MLYPKGSGSSERVPKKSYKNVVHDGQRGEQPIICVPHKDNVQLGTDYDNNSDHSMLTTNKTHFKQPCKSTPVKAIRPKGQLSMSDCGKAKFNAVSQNQLDYKYNEFEAKSAKPNLCLEHPSLINLSMDVPVDFQTVKMMSYNDNNSFIYTKNNNLVKKQDRYSPPKEKFDATTTNQDVFQNFGVQPRVSGMRPTTQRKSSAKFGKNSSSYATTFKNPGHTQRVIYNAQYENNLHLPPKSEKFTDTSVMRSSYQNGSTGKGKQFERVKPFKPENKTYNASTDPFQGLTEYNEIFKDKNYFSSCVFPKYLAKEEASRKFATALKS